MKLQTVYILTKVEDELPQFPINIGMIGNRIPIIVNHLGNGNFKSLAFTEKVIEKGCTSFLKPTEAFVFTLEELKQLLSDAFDAGNLYGTNNTAFNYGRISRGEAEAVNNREEYIENFLNKEQ